MWTYKKSGEYLHQAGCNFIPVFDYIEIRFNPKKIEPNHSFNFFNISTALLFLGLSSRDFL